MSGATLTDLRQNQRGRAILPALFFVLGLSTVFLLDGLCRLGHGRLFLSYQQYFNWPRAG